MDSIWTTMMSAALVALGLFLLTKYQVSKKWKWRDRFDGFDEAVRGVEQTNMAYFRSLELMLRNMESVRALTEQAEQRLWGIVARPGIERHDRYEAAELLLAQGEKPAKVASMLNLPLSQVKSLGDPQKFSNRERTIAVKKMIGGNDRFARQGRAESPFTWRTKKPRRPVQHAEAGVNGGIDFCAGENNRPRFNGSVE